MHARATRAVMKVMAWRRLTIGILFFALASGLGQTFNVASVKALVGATHGGPNTITLDGVNFQGSSLGFLVRWAYGLHPYQTFETVGPAWIDAGLGCVWFSIAAKADHPVPVDQLRLMLRGLLAERLKLTVHRETREMPVYLLTIAKGGPKLRKSDAEVDDLPKFSGTAMEFKGQTIGRLIENLGHNVSRLLLDETQLEGGYEFTIDVFKYEDYFTGVPGGRTNMDAGVNRALQDLGLKLEAARRPVEVLVIDHAEKTPVEN
jgi:uncharacterized protein (TIGR03435 family)